MCRFGLGHLLCVRLAVPLSARQSFAWAGGVNPQVARGKMPRVLIHRWDCPDLTQPQGCFPPSMFKCVFICNVYIYIYMYNSQGLSKRNQEELLEVPLFLPAVLPFLVSLNVTHGALFDLKGEVFVYTVCWVEKP